MKMKAICFLLIAVFAGIALGNLDTLHIELVDSLDAPSNYDFFHYGESVSWPFEYSYSGTKNWDLAMGDSLMVWLPGIRNMIFVDPYNIIELDTIIDPHAGSRDIVLAEVSDSILFTGGGYIFIAYCIRLIQLLLLALYILLTPTTILRLWRTAFFIHMVGLWRS